MTAYEPTKGSREAVLRLSGLRVSLQDGPAIVESVDLRVGRGEILGLVGESGSGKTTTALCLLGYCDEGVKILEGTLEVTGKPLRMDDSMRAARGAVISYIPQDPSRALNPALRIVSSIDDVVRTHRGRDAAEDTSERMLDIVGLPRSREFARRFPHELSGGQQQRVSIALALSCEPSVIILDEPTTGLDVITQDKILAELLRLRDEQHVSLIYVTHDLAVVSRIADRIAVMYAGRIVEHGRSDVILRRPRHPYTRGLLAAIPDHLRPRLLEPMPGIAVSIGERPDGCAFAPRCPQRDGRCEAAMPSLAAIAEEHEVRCFHWQITPPVGTGRPLPSPNDKSDRPVVLCVEGLRAGHTSRRTTVVAAADVSFTVEGGRCVALVGESGSGKTTIARVIAGLHPPMAGRICLHGAKLEALVRRRSLSQRRSLQLVGQNPADALNPRHTAFDTIARPARTLRSVSRREIPREVARLLDLVRLPARIGDRYPRELSGGERQRIAIARALAAGPELMLCDEITSALDVSVQAAILDLLMELRRELGLSLLFITHDLGVVAAIADEVLVLEGGIVCERGAAMTVLREPQHPYTQRLLEAAPSVSSVGDGSVAPSSLSER